MTSSGVSAAASAKSVTLTHRKQPLDRAEADGGVHARLTSAVVENVRWRVGRGA